MAIKRLIASNSQEVEALAQALLQGKHQLSDPWVFLVSDHSTALQYKKRWVKKDFIFGLEILSFSSWLEDRWELYGDGRHVVSAAQRKIFLCKALLHTSKEKGLRSLSLSFGTVEMLSRMAQKEFAALLASKQDMSVYSHLSPAEKELLNVLSVYGSLIHEQGLAELSDLMSSLSMSAWPSPRILVENFDELGRCEQNFLESLSERLEVCAVSKGIHAPITCEDRSQELIEIQSRIFNPQAENPVLPQGALEILLPSGQYAAPLLIAQTLKEHIQKGCTRIALSSTCPIEAFSYISSFFAGDAIKIHLTTSKGFCETDFGKLWRSLLAWRKGSADYRVLMVEMLFNPLTCTDESTRTKLDARWRMDRTGDAPRYLEDIAACNSFLFELIELVEHASYLSIVDKLEALIAGQCTSDPCYRAQQLAACESTRQFLNQLSSEMLDSSLYAEVLFSSNIPVNISNTEKNSCKAEVDIFELRQLSRMPACSYDAVCICDMEASRYPIKVKENAQTILFEKLGIGQEEDVFELERDIFFEALSVAKKSLICERVLFDTDANPSYPAIMFEELIDCYREDLRSEEDKDKITGLPYSLLPFSKTLGEDMLYQQLSMRNDKQDKMLCVPSCETGQLEESSLEKVIAPFLKHEQAGGAMLSLSPSSLESYLRCPYFWFVGYRLNVSGIDAGFGPLEKGSFIHQVLKDFYLAYQKDFEPKLSVRNLKEAQDLFEGVFDEHLLLQYKLEPRNNPLIAHTALEQAELKELKEDTLRFLEQETLLLPGFEPRYFEHYFGKEKTLMYAGAALRGSVDRIDVNEKGQAVVIDYKGTLSKDYAFASASPVPWAGSPDQGDDIVLPHKVQTLLYAQAVRRDLDLDVVAALYVSYGKKTQVLGAYDPRVLGPAELLGINPDTCAIDLDTHTDFSCMLDDIEVQLEPVVQAMEQGMIRPFPRGSDPCAYCPVFDCKFRRQI